MEVGNLVGMGGKFEAQAVGEESAGDSLGSERLT
jgi:hypothetical protein